LSEVRFARETPGVYRLGFLFSALKFSVHWKSNLVPLGQQPHLALTKSSHDPTRCFFWRMIMKFVHPSIRETAFSCPHCGAYTSQTWYQLFCKTMDGELRKPFLPTELDVEIFIKRKDIDNETKDFYSNYVNRLNNELPFISTNKNPPYITSELNNSWVSVCFNCSEISIWVYDYLVFPNQKEGNQPNGDIPPDIKRDIEEARSILKQSPRGSAALLRLSIQKICIHLGEKGKNIDDDIASLVKKGLNPMVQQSLDVVRVIGNEAVHPGVIDLRDNRDIAERLFDLVNLIAEQMITHPNTVKHLYEKLPASKLKAIVNRDK